MNINSILKKEGITVVKELTYAQISTIAKSISSKLCLAFPEHKFNKSSLFNLFCKIDMYIAKMPADSSGAKYLYKNNSIYFNADLKINEMINVAVHECIHFLQRQNNTSKLGLYDFKTGLALNEAAVQLMASEANFNIGSSEKYFNISLADTISPNYYPLECSIVSQMAYFTGTYPLYDSTLNGNSIFANTFIEKCDSKTYSLILDNLDTLLALENELNYFILELQYAKRIKTIRLLNNLIDSRKNNITVLFFKTQNLIIKKCFSKEFNNIRDKDGLKEFKNRIYNFKNLIGTSDNYTFFNNFYCDMMNALEQKENVLEKYTAINLFEELSSSLSLVDTSKSAFEFIKIFTTKFKKVFEMNKQKNDINEF